MIVHRLRAGQRAKAATGKKATGSYAYGTRPNGANGRDRDAEADPHGQAAIARVLELHRAGQSTRAIARTLDAEGYRPKRAARWTSGMVSIIVRRELTAA